ncbi:MAG: DUF3135 domain-containing protein [Burkholderiales bacterium]|nr:DUF3135 domain-containing protein [Burkholderiales bacterium]
MGPADQKDFSFEEWAALAREDGEAFERRRQQLIESMLAAAPERMQRRLRGLQFQIDLERERAGTPLGVAVRLNSMMWSSFADLRDALAGVGESVPQQPRMPEAGAQLIPFPKRS